MRFDTERLASILGFDTQTLSQEADTSYTGKHVKGLFTYYVSQNQGFLDPPSPPRQLSSAFARRPFCTTIFDVDFFAGDIHL